TLTRGCCARRGVVALRTRSRSGKRMLATHPAALTTQVAHPCAPVRRMRRTPPARLARLACLRSRRSWGGATESAKLPGMRARWYFDLISPYAYLHLKQFRKLPTSLEIEYVPVLFAGMLKHHGHKGPA